MWLFAVVTRWCYTCLLCLVSLSLWAQDQETFALKGKLLDAETKEPVPLVTILVVNKEKGVSGDSNGKFNIPVAIGDQLRISSIGYEPLELIVTEDFRDIEEELVLFMIPATYELDSVVVIHLTDDFYLKRKKGKPIEIIGLPKPTAFPRDWSKTQITPGTIYGGGATISGLLNVFDRELQQKKRVKELQAALDKEKALKDSIDAKFNKEIVKEITGIDDRVIDEFMAFCNFTTGEILRLSEYEIHLRLLNRYHAFLRR